MSITKRQGIGGVSRIRKLARAGAASQKERGKLDPDSRNGRRVIKKLRAQLGDEVVDAELAKLRRDTM